MDELKLTDLKVGATYRAKKPRKKFGEYNDRTILWIGKGLDKRSRTYIDMVQYDSITVGIGRNYPKISAERFLKWVSHEIKEETEEVKQ